QVGLGANHEEAEQLMQLVETFEIEIAAIHHNVGAGFGHEEIEHVDIVHLAIGNVDKYRNGAVEIDHGVELDGALGATEVRPRKEGQTQVDDRSVECVHRRIQVQAEILVGVERSRNADETL